MTMDSLLRKEGRRLRDDVLVTLDVARAWEELTDARRRRRRAAGLVGVAAAVASVVLAVTLVSEGPAAVDRDAPPVDSPTDAPSRQGGYEDGCVDSVVVQCLGAGMVRVRGGVTYRFIIPPGFDPQMKVGVTTRITDIFQERTRAGVSVMSRVVPADKGARELDAEGLARWVASRPYLDGADVSRELLNGRPAWSVRFSEAADPWGSRSPQLGETCNDQQPSCRPLLRAPDGHESGPWTAMTSRYWFMDVPREGVTALWSWTFEDADDAMQLNERLVDSVVIELAEDLSES